MKKIKEIYKKGNVDLSRAEIITFLLFLAIVLGINFWVNGHDLVAAILTTTLVSVVSLIIKFIIEAVD